MKYKELRDPEEILKVGDQFVNREELINNDTPPWRNEVTDIGQKISKFPEYTFRRPEPDPIEVKLNEYYTAEIYSNKVIVNNCASGVFTFEAVEYLHTMIKRVKEGRGEQITTEQLGDARRQS